MTTATQSPPPQQQDHNTRIQRLVLELNKTGLAYLANEQGQSNSYDYFKKAEKMLNSQMQIEPQNKGMQRLQAVTYNNLAIYYKRINKPKAALTYLKNALEIQTFKLEDWLATASTHLNICAIYSFMNKYTTQDHRHEQAIDHANLSIENAQKAKQQNQQAKRNKDSREKQKQKQKEWSNAEKSCNNIELASLYNLAVQYEHLKRYEEAIQTYKKAKSNAKELGRKNIESNSQESIDRLMQEQTKNRKKIVELLQKRKQNEEKGNYESMRRNKKNYKPKEKEDDMQNINDSTTGKTQKYNLYNDHKKRTQSVGRILALQPLRSQSTEGIKRQTNQGNTEKVEGKSKDMKMESAHKLEPVNKQKPKQRSSRPDKQIEKQQRIQSTKQMKKK